MSQSHASAESVTILVVYASTFGNTKKLSESVRDGAGSIAGSRVTMLDAQDVTLLIARPYDAIIVGSPVRHRSADSRIKALIERVFEVGWLTDDFVGRVAGVFTVGGGYGDCAAGCELTQLGVLSAMAACGMLIIPLPKTTPGFSVSGTHWGPHARSGGPEMEPIGITTAMCEAGFHHGANVARTAAALRGQALFATGNESPSAELRSAFAKSGM